MVMRSVTALPMAMSPENPTLFTKVDEALAVRVSPEVLPSVELPVTFRSLVTESPPVPVMAIPPPAKVTPPPPEANEVVAVMVRASAALFPRVRVPPVAEKSPAMFAALVTDNPPAPVRDVPPATVRPLLKVEVAVTVKTSVTYINPVSKRR